MKPIWILHEWKRDAEVRLGATERGRYWLNSEDITGKIRASVLAHIAVLDGLIAAETRTDCQTYPR